MKKWVDITTIDNTVPFMQVRWLETLTIPKGDAWFSEAPGLVTDNMIWNDGNTAALGYYGGHRFNNNSYGKNYTCGFNCEEWGIDTGLDPDVFHTHIKDGPRNSYYDSTVVINNKTYYEVDFSLWDYAKGKNLYMPYANCPFSPGEIYVNIDTSTLSVNPTSKTFNATGGTSTFVVESDYDWTGVQSDNWFTVSSLTGTTGTTNITVTAPTNYSANDRTGTITFDNNVDSFVVTIKQRANSEGTHNIKLGELTIIGMYLGATPINTTYIGDKLLFSR